jgi:SAM-dependent methyltransferase
VGQGPDAPDRMLFRHLLKMSELSKRKSILEVGCGAGIEVEGLAMMDAEFDYLGLDLTPEFVDYCRDRFSPFFRFEVGDATTSPLTEEPFDIVYSRATLEHIGAKGEKAFRNLLEASKHTTIISWFIRPAWDENQVGVERVGDFVHHTYSARKLIQIAARYGDLYRFDFDHHSTKASVWLICKDRQRSYALARTAHRYLATDEFLDSLLPVPPDPQEQLHALRDVLAQARDGYQDVISTASRVPDLLDILRGSHENMERVLKTYEFLAEAASADLSDESERMLRAKERIVGALNHADDDDVAVAIQQARDAQRRAEDALR